MQSYFIRLLPVVTIVGMNHVLYKDERLKTKIKTWSNCGILNYVPKPIKYNLIGEKNNINLPKN